MPLGASVQTTYIQQLRLRLGDQLAQLPAISPSVQSHAARISSILAAAPGAGAEAAAAKQAALSSTGDGGRSQEELRQAVWEMHLFDRWLPREIVGMDTAVGTGLAEDTETDENASASDASLSYGLVDEVEAVVQQRQTLQLSQLSLYMRDKSWRTLLPALTRLIQPRPGDTSGCDEFVTLYRLLYGLTCANGRRGVTIARR